jgi:hypothetical protein
VSTSLENALEHHFEPNPNDNFKMEPEQTRRLGDAYPDFQSVKLNPPAFAGGC